MLFIFRRSYFKIIFLIVCYFVFKCRFIPYSSFYLVFSHAHFPLSFSGCVIDSLHSTEIFFPWRWGGGGSSTQAWMRTYVSILRIPQMIWVWRATVEWYWQGKTEELGDKPVPVPLCPPQIPHWLIRARTRASAVRGRRLTTWAMARPDGTISFRYFPFPYSNPRSISLTETFIKYASLAYHIIPRILHLFMLQDSCQTQTWNIMISNENRQQQPEHLCNAHVNRIEQTTHMKLIFGPFSSCNDEWNYR
jgi:hypothetical protein